ncbi:hypothetical protein E2542_SST14018 [Spatholobus suberectus]|nr:hypothetical protein E2542_SST14018 [Spatholobus suberectus]
MVVEGLVPINQATNVSEFLNMARDGYGSLLVETVLFLCLLEKLHEERVVDVHDRHHEPLLLLPLTHLDCHAPFWDASELVLLPIAVAMVRMETPRTLLPYTHFLPPRNKDKENRSKRTQSLKEKVTGKRG